MQFLKVPYMLLRAPLSPEARFVYAQLLSLPEPRSPRIATLARQVGLSHMAVKRSITELRRAGMLQTQRGKYASTYLLTPLLEAVNGLCKSCDNSNARRIKLSRLPDQIDPSRSLLLLETLNRVQPPPEPAASAAHARLTAPRRTGASKQTPPRKKPKPKQELPPTEGASPYWWPHDDDKVAAVRATLQELAQSIRFPPPDDWIVRRVLDATNGASAAAIRHRIRDLALAHRFDGMRSWALVPLALAPWFKAHAAS